MIVGFYDHDGRPTVKGLVAIEEISIECVVDFLVDTGADVTCLHYPDTAVAGVSHRLLEEIGDPVEVGGIGGSAEYFVADAIVYFADNANYRLLSYDIELYIAATSQEGIEQPSLLGRDILDRHKMIYNPANQQLELYRQ